MKKLTNQKISSVPHAIGHMNKGYQCRYFRKRLEWTSWFPPREISLTDNVYHRHKQAHQMLTRG